MKQRVVYLYYMEGLNLYAISLKVNKSYTFVKSVIDDYNKPLIKEEFMTIESKMNSDVF